MISYEGDNGKLQKPSGRKSSKFSYKSDDILIFIPKIL